MNNDNTNTNATEINSTITAPVERRTKYSRKQAEELLTELGFSGLVHGPQFDATAFAPSDYVSEVMRTVIATTAAQAQFVDLSKALERLVSRHGFSDVLKQIDQHRSEMQEKIESAREAFDAACAARDDLDGRLNELADCIQEMTGKRRREIDVADLDDAESEITELEELCGV